MAAIPEGDYYIYLFNNDGVTWTYKGNDLVLGFSQQQFHIQSALSQANNSYSFLLKNLNKYVVADGDNLVLKELIPNNKEFAASASFANSVPDPRTPDQHEFSQEGKNVSKKNNKLVLSDESGPEYSYFGLKN